MWCIMIHNTLHVVQKNNIKDVISNTYKIYNIEIYSK